MSDTYQAIYDAVRSRIHGCDMAQVIGDAVRQSTDMSYAIPALMQDIALSFAQHARPSAVYRPVVSLDQGIYCLLYGKDLMSGVAGFGETMEKAALDFDKNWRELKAPKPMMSADGGGGGGTFRYERTGKASAGRADEALSDRHRHARP